MLNHLKFSVTFPTGKSISHDLDFTSGLTTITGPNGKGKSLILEMVCFALWGIKAVRGGADDYKKCNVTLDFEVKNVSYKVKRSGINAKLISEDSVLAVGTTAVNQRIASIFGYPYSVFAVSNLVGQGQIEALSTMLPAERKKLIDTTIGLDAVDVVIKWAGEQASLANKEAEALSSLLVAPEEPVRPENYETSEAIKEGLKTLIENKTIRDRIVGWLANEPEFGGFPVWVDVIPEQAQVTAYNEAVALRNSLNKQIASIPEATMTLEQVKVLREELERSIAWDTYDVAVAKLPKQPELTVEQIEAQLTAWAEYTAWDSAKKAFDAHKVTCPNCSHEFSPAGYAAVVGEVAQPTIARTTLLEWKEAWAKLASKPSEPSVPRPVDAKVYPKSQLDLWEGAARRAEDRKALVEQLAALPELGEDPTPLWNKYVQHVAAEAAANKQFEIYTAWQKEAEQKREALARLEGIDEKITAANSALSAALLYEAQVAAYDAKLATYNDGVVRVEAAAFRAAEMKKSAAAMRELKLRVKSFLVPSLNRVSSHLIRTMTEGQHQELFNVEVDEEFNIKVDGQSLETLNGSGKTVANLALRIALGQILTNRVFSVLMVDEVDAACDDERAEAIAECLRGLTQTIKQVVSVTHKSIKADNYVEV